MALSWLDVAVIALYLVAITLFGMRFRKGQHSIRDYFLGGRRLPWWAISLSIVSAETSILTIISTPGIAFQTNMAFLQLVLGYLVGRVGGSVSLIPRYFSGEIYTAYQMIERRFGSRVRSFTAGLFLLTRALAEGVRVFAIAIVVEVVFKTGMIASLVVITALTLFYTFEGGLAAVIWTDVIQLVIYICGTLAALMIALHSLPGGWATVREVAAQAGDKFQVFDFHFNLHQPYLFLSGLIGGAFLTSASHGTDQLIVQRLLAARNQRQSQAALLSSGVVILLQFTLFLVTGVVLFAFFKAFPHALHFTRADQIFPDFVATQLPAGLAGLVIAAILAAGMANLSAALNALASSTVVDFYRPFLKPRADERHYLLVSRFMTLVWGAMLVAIALAAGLLHRSVLELALTLASIPYGSMLGIFLLGALSPRSTAPGVLTGAVAGLLALAAVIAFTHIAWTWYVVIGTVTTVTVGLLASYIWPKPVESKE